MHRALLIALAVLGAGCAAAFPRGALRAVDREVSAGDLTRDPAAYVGRRVMVGGDIVATRPMPGETEIEILSKPLSADDQPRRGDVSEGRVLARSAQFLDPAIYAEGRRLTVIGTVTGEEQRKIGELSYRYPVLSTSNLHLWPREVPVPAYGPPWFYDPWFYPRSWSYRVYGPWLDSPYCW